MVQLGRETQDINIPTHKLNIRFASSKNPPEKIEQEKQMPGMFAGPKPFSIHVSAAAAH